MRRFAAATMTTTAIAMSTAGTVRRLRALPAAITITAVLSCAAISTGPARQTRNPSSHWPANRSSAPRNRRVVNPWTCPPLLARRPLIDPISDTDRTIEHTQDREDRTEHGLHRPISADKPEAGSGPSSVAV